MSMCEWCWARAFGRELANPMKSQAEYYREIVAEQDAKGAQADCPNARVVRGASDE